MEGTGPPLALLHGWALDLAYWDPLVERLAPRFTLLRFDRRGFGLSTGLPDIHRNVEDLCAVMDEAGIGRAVLAGMSQGARLAIHFACRNTTRTRALLLDGPPALEAETELPMQQLRNLLESQGEAALQASILNLQLMRLEKPAAAMQGLLRRIVARYRGLDLLHPRAHASPPDLASIRLPACVLNGAHDSPERLAAGRAIAAAISGARHVELAGAGHLALLDDPDDYARAMDAFCLALPP
jgi:pimeloyl-ACP methyl ester carboxylesterase